MRGTKAVVLSGVFGLLGVGCVQTALNPTDQVALTGTAQKQDKTALVTTELSLERSENSACLITKAFSKPKTDAQGAFLQDLTGADTQNGDIARCFRLSLPAGENGARLWADFLVQVTEVKVPTLQQWTGGATAGPTATGAEFKFDDLSSSHGLTGLTYTVEARVGNGTVWTHRSATSPVAFTDYLLEDFAATAVALASHSQKGSGTTFTLAYQSDGAALPSPGKVPASRGAACTYPGAPSACPLTDGKLDRVQFASGVAEVTVTLSAAKVLKKAVLRGLQVTAPATVVLEGSADGATWSKLADVSSAEHYQALELAAGAAVTQVRLKGTRTDDGTFDLLNLDELSLFE